MTELEVRSYQESDQEAVVQLWKDCVSNGTCSWLH